MLELQAISKQYQTGELIQKALDGVSLTLRDSEFVCVLGPSGSGKTTLLNIIGGLDRYDSGDLKINGVSTKQYKDRDWDSYRNHSIGFVFQSYNLIPHQSVLANVELALTISGVSRAERRKRAKAALAEVGLAGQEHKRPNQMSGGQMQRVAIARALVNDPEILLADEPTGALDTETSLQIMELLKKVAEKRLVVMVTHNPELADSYATRIVKLRDGKIVDDSDPCTETAASETHRQGRARMSFLTALALSGQNLRTKKARTLLTAFAGSIGIIGIALILALSNGVQGYIDDIQRDTMSSYPITIQARTLRLDSIIETRDAMMSARMGQLSAMEEPAGTEVTIDYTALESSEAITSSIAENDLSAFKRYLDDPDSEIRDHIGENGVVYSYDVRFEVYTYDPDGNLRSTDADPQTGTNSRSYGGFGSFGSFFGGGSGEARNFSELLRDADGEGVSRVMTDSYELLYGAWPTEKDELVLVLNADCSLSAETLYQLGLLTDADYNAAAEAIKAGEEPEAHSWSYPALCDRSYYLIPACDRYRENEDGGFSYVGETEPELESLLEQALELKITGIVRPVERAANTSIFTALGYPSSLTAYLIDCGEESAVVQAQERDPEINVLTGMRFEAPDEDAKIEDAKSYLSTLGVSDKATIYSMILYYQSTGQAGEEPTETEPAETEPEQPLPSDIPADWMTMSPDSLPEGMPEGLPEGFSAQEQMPTGESGMAAMLDLWLEQDPDPDILLAIYDQYVAGESFEQNMERFGRTSYDTPTAISIYTDSFEAKDAVAASIEHYNEGVEENRQITYTDYVALITSSITSIINVISYVLIAFVAVSLVVSCIMIGIITHISVLERTKEIGILRALGASKRNISHVFNAETVIIGLCSGLLGVGVSLLLTIPINALLRHLTDSENIGARLPAVHAVILIVLSVGITVLGGLIPARKAARKDPVVALRTE